jgi:MFS family permease
MAHSLSEPATARKGASYAVLAASLAFMMIGTGSIYFIVVALKLITAEFQWPRAVPSIAYALQFVGSGVGGIAMGWLLDKRGMGLPAFIGALMTGSGAILISFISSPWELFLIYGVMLGFLGRAAFFSPLMANITRWFESRKSMAVGVVGSGQGLAGAIWPPVFQHAFTEIGWRETSVWYGVFVLATLLPLSIILRMRPPTAPASTAAVLGPTGSRLNLSSPISPLRMQAALSVAIVGCCIAMALPLAHVVSHVSDIGFDASRGAEVLSLMLASAALSSFFGVGFLGTRLGGLRTIFIFSSAQAIFLTCLAFVDSLPALYLTGVLFGLGYGGILPCYPVVVREFLPAGEAGRRTGVVILCGSIGMGIGAWLGGAVFDLTGTYKTAFLIGVVSNVANLAIIGNLILRTRVRAIPV